MYFVRKEKVIYRANTKHPLYSVLQQLVKKHLRLDEIVEAIIRRICDVQKIILIGDYAKGIDSGQIEVLLIANDINMDYLNELEKKLKNKIGRKVVFSIESEEEGIVLYDKEIMYYEN